MDIVNKAIVDLTKDDYLNFHRSISKGSKTQANRVVEVIRLVEQYAEETDLIKKRVAHFKKKELNKEIDRLDREDPYSFLDLQKYRKATLKLIKKDPKYLVPCLALRGACLIGARSKDQVFNLKWEPSVKKLLYSIILQLLSGHKYKNESKTEKLNSSLREFNL